LPIPSFVGVLQERVGSLASGLSVVGHEKPSAPVTQTTVGSAAQPEGATVTPLLLPWPPLPLPLLPLPPLLLAVPLAVVEHPSSAPVLPPPTAAMATVKKSPLTVFQT
jgi:hypothetical protein